MALAVMAGMPNHGSPGGARYALCSKSELRSLLMKVAGLIGVGVVALGSVVLAGCSSPRRVTTTMSSAQVVWVAHFFESEGEMATHVKSGQEWGLFSKDKCLLVENIGADHTWTGTEITTKDPVAHGTYKGGGKTISEVDSLNSKLDFTGTYTSSLSKPFPGAPGYSGRISSGAVAEFVENTTCSS